MRFVSVLAVLTLAMPVVADVRSDAEKAFAECRALTVKKDEAGTLAAADRAARLWATIAKESPNDAIPHLRLGQVDLECRIGFAGFMDKGRLLGEIETNLNRAIALDSKQWDAHYRLGVLFYNVPAFLRRTDDAISHLERSIVIDPARHEHPYILLAELYERKGQNDKARATLQEGTKRLPESMELRKLLSEKSASNGGSQPAAPAVDQTATITAIVEKYVARPEIAGVSVAVIHAGKVLLTEGFGHADVENEVKASANTVYRIGSISKTFVAAAVLKLVEDEKVSLDDPVTKWLAEAPASASAITIQHLLSHTSGLSRDAVRDSSWIRATLEAPRSAVPGVTFSYSNVGFALLGEIIEVASKRSYADYLRDEILDPLALNATTECDEKSIIRHRAEGYSWGGGGLVNDAPLDSSVVLRYAGGLCSSITDMVRWITLLREGKLSPAIWEAMTTPRSLNDGSARPHAFGFRVAKGDGGKVISHSGAVNGFLSRIVHDETKQVTIVVLINSESGDPSELAQMIAKSFEGQ